MAKFPRRYRLAKQHDFVLSNTLLLPPSFQGNTTSGAVMTEEMAPDMLPLHPMALGSATVCPSLGCRVTGNTPLRFMKVG